MRAPRICSGIGCTKILHPGEDCPFHPRRQWDKSRSTVDRSNTKHRRWLKSNHVGPDKPCALGYVGCTGIATELDRIDCHGGYTEGNVQGLCHHCHQRKTSQEGNRAQGANVADPKYTVPQPDPAEIPHNLDVPAPQHDAIPRRIDTVSTSAPTQSDDSYWPLTW